MRSSSIRTHARLPALHPREEACHSLATDQAAEWVQDFQGALSVCVNSR